MNPPGAEMRTAPQSYGALSAATREFVESCKKTELSVRPSEPYGFMAMQWSNSPGTSMGGQSTIRGDLHDKAAPQSRLQLQCCESIDRTTRSLASTKSYPANTKLVFGWITFRLMKMNSLLSA